VLQGEIARNARQAIVEGKKKKGVKFQAKPREKKMPREREGVCESEANDIEALNS
jgi:hypothetical protein